MLLRCRRTWDTEGRMWRKWQVRFETRKSHCHLKIRKRSYLCLRLAFKQEKKGAKNLENGWKDFPITHVKFIEHHALFQDVDALTIVLVEISGMMHWNIQRSLSLPLDTHTSVSFGQREDASTSSEDLCDTRRVERAEKRAPSKFTLQTGWNKTDCLFTFQRWRVPSVTTQSNS